MKITVFPVFLQNVTDKPDTQKIVIFDHFFMKNGRKWHFPLGLDRGFGHFGQSCPTVVSVVSLWCHFRQKQQKPLGLDRDFDENQ